MIAIQPGQVLEETISKSETRRFKVVNVSLDQVHILDKDQAHLSVYPYGRTLHAPDILSNPAKYKLIP